MSMMMILSASAALWAPAAASAAGASAAAQTLLPKTRLTIALGGQDVAQGFMVVVALGLGFGSATGRYLEAAGTCRTAAVVAAGRRTAAIEPAIVASAPALPGADPRRIVVVGRSAGGRGSNGTKTIRAGEERLVAAERTFGAGNRLPRFWLHAADDHFFRADLAHRVATAYAGASALPVVFVDLPPFGDDGHKTFAQAQPSAWAAAVFLAKVVGR